MEDPNPVRGLWGFRSLSHLRDSSARFGGTLRSLRSYQQSYSAGSAHLVGPHWVGPQGTASRAIFAAPSCDGQDGPGSEPHDKHGAAAGNTGR